MIRTLKIMVFAVVMACLGDYASAADVHFDGGGGDGLWSTAANWNDDAVPTSSVPARAINVPGYGPIISISGAQCSSLIVGDWGWDGELTIEPAGTLTVGGGDVVIGVSENKTGILKNSGSITISGKLYVGYSYEGSLGNGTLNMEGGTIAVAGTLDLGMGNSKGRINLYGGTISANSLTVDTADSSIDITAGVLILNGNQIESIISLIQAGVLTGYGRTDRLSYDYNIAHSGKTTIVAGSHCPLGDLTGNCSVGIEDFRLFADQWLSEPNCSANDNSDFDCVGGVDFYDYSKFSQNWLKIAQPLPRIAAQANQTDPKFYNTQTGGYFTPLGSNYVPLDWINGVAYHTAFTTGLYDPVAAEAALTRMQRDGYNTVRVFLDRGDPEHQARGQYSTAGPLATDNSLLYKPYLDNFIDFLRRARAHHIYVIPTFHMWPHNFYYENIANSNVPPNVENVSIIIFSQNAINAQKTYLTRFVQAVEDAEPNGNLLSTVFAWELANEISVDVSLKPFSLTTGTVTPADGITYDMSDASSRQQCMDSGINYWTNQLTASIKAVDPNAMVSLSVFTYQAVGKTFALNSGVLPRTGGQYFDVRFPARPGLLLANTTLSYVDVHMYPSGPSYSIDDDLSSSEYSSWNRSAKPLIMGEFGAFKDFYFYDIYWAAWEMTDHRQNAFNKGFKGALFWTWDTFSQTELWHMLDEGGIINDALKP